MAATNYIIAFKKSNTKFIASYKNGLFHKLTHKSGQLQKMKGFDKLMLAVPQIEDEIDLYQTNFEPNVTYIIQSGQRGKTFYSKMLDAYFTFYVKKTGLAPRMNATEGKALKQIITHLIKLCATDTEAIETWSVIFTNWDKLDKFYQDQLELRQINSNINIILRQIKNGNSTTAHKQSANNNANDLRESL